MQSFDFTICAEHCQLMDFLSTAQTQDEIPKWRRNTVQCTCSLYAGPPEPPSECQVLNQTQAELAVECRLGYRKWQLEISQTLLQNHLSTVSSV